MTRRLILACSAALVVSLAITASASAVITMSAPVNGLTYLNTVAVSWTTTTVPTSVEMIWEYTSGPYASSVKEPVEVQLNVSESEKLAKKGSFTFKPKEPLNGGKISELRHGQLLDGTWKVHMIYVQEGGLMLSSATATGITITTETIPPVLTSPASGSHTLNNTLNVSLSLPSSPSTETGKVKLSFKNLATSEVTTLVLKPNTESAFTVNPNALTTSSNISSVEGPTSLPDGTYNVSLTYSDIYNHEPASVTSTNWILKRSTHEPTLISATGGGENQPLVVSYQIPEEALAQSVTLDLTGPTDAAITLADTSEGIHTVTLQPNNLFSSADVLQVSPSASALLWGGYEARVSYRDWVGNAPSTSNSASFALSGQAPTLALTGGGTGGQPLALSYTLQEAALTGALTLELKGPKTTVLTLSETGVGTHTLTLEPAELASSEGVSSVAHAAVLPEGTYEAILSAKNPYGDPALTSQPVEVEISPVPQAPQSSSPSPTTTSSSSVTETSSTAASTWGSVASAPLAVAPSASNTGGGGIKILRARANAATGALSITLALAAGGRLEVAGTLPGTRRSAPYGRTGSVSPAASVQTVTIRPTAATRAMLGRRRRRGHAVRVALLVTFTPIAGVRQSAEVTLALPAARRL